MTNAYASNTSETAKNTKTPAARGLARLIQRALLFSAPTMGMVPSRILKHSAKISENCPSSGIIYLSEILFKEVLDFNASAASNAAFTSCDI